MATDLYKTLGVERTASEKEIRSAYRKLARKYHPDVNPGNRGAEERFKEINTAYEVLIDPENRKNYDKYGDDWMHAEQIEEMRKQQSAGSWFRDGPRNTTYTYTSGDPEQFGDLGDIFGSVFGGRRQAGPRRGADMEVAVQVTLEEAASSTRRTVRLEDGRRIEVTVPAGVRTGSRVRIAGQGEPGYEGGTAGDLYLFVEVLPHARIERRGDDLLTEIEVPLFDAVLGGEVMVSTLDGRVALTIPEGTQNGKQFRLRGKGMPHLGTPGKRGDLLARVNVRLPEQLGAEERELFEQLRTRQSEPAARAGER